MDLDYLKKQVLAAYDEGEQLGTDGPEYAALVAYLYETTDRDCARKLATAERRLAKAKEAAADVHACVMDMAFDPQSASKAFAVGVALRALEDALGIEHDANKEPGRG